MSNTTPIYFNLKYFLMCFVIFAINLFLITPHVFGGEVIVETHSSNQLAVKQHQIIEEAKFSIKVSERVVSEAIEAKSDAKEFLKKLKLEIETGGIAEEDIEILENGIQEILFEADEDISLAQKLIETSIEKIAEAKNIIRTERISIEQSDDALNKLNDDLELAKKEQRQILKRISEADEVTEAADRSKSELLNLLSCEPKPDSLDALTARLYQYIRYYHEWYFHGFGCDEDKLVKVARGFALRSSDNLEDFMRVKHHSAPEQGMAKISLKNRLEEERYKECLLRLEHKPELILEANNLIESQLNLKLKAEKEKQIAKEEVARLDIEINRLNESKQAASWRKNKAENKKLIFEYINKQKYLANIINDANKIIETAQKDIERAGDVLFDLHDDEIDMDYESV